MQNLAIFLESNKDAAYYRQQVSERGVLENIDALNDGLLRIKGVDEENLSRIYEVLNDIEISLNKNANDPRTRMALQKFAIAEEKVEEKAAATEEMIGTDPDGGVIGEQGEQGEVPTGEPDPAENVDTTELAGSIPGEPGFTEKVDTTEPTDESTKETPEPTGEPDPEKKVDTTETPEQTEKKEDGGIMKKTEPTTEAPADIDGVPAPKKGGRKKKETE